MHFYKQNEMAIFPEPYMPDEKDIVLARSASCILSVLASKKNPSIEMSFKDGDRHIHATIPISAFNLLIEALNLMSEGNAVTLMTIHAELTKQQAADLLNVSSTFLGQLLDEHQIPFTKVESKIRISYQDLMDYKSKIDTARRKVLDELTQEAQELNIGY